MAKRVFSELVTAWRFAACPTSRSSSVKATIDGVVRAPSEFSITRACDPSMMATQELVVPRSMPMTLDMHWSFRAAIYLAGPKRPPPRIPVRAAAGAAPGLAGYIGLGFPARKAGRREAGGDSW